MTSGGSPSAGERPDPDAQPCLFLVCHGELRPDANAIRNALGAAKLGMVSHDPSLGDHGEAHDAGWLELLIDGLTYDVLGLMPGRALEMPPIRHRFGLAAADLSKAAAFGLAPGPHLAGAPNSPPVVRALLRLGAALATHLPAVEAVVWQPAASLIGRDLFAHAITQWLSGGVFPALGLTGVVEDANGTLASDGLDFFVGQEIALDPELCANRVEATRLLLRLVDRFAEQGPLEKEAMVPMAGGGSLRLIAERDRITASRG